MLHKFIKAHFSSLLVGSYVLLGTLPIVSANDNPWYHVMPLQSGPVSVLIDFQVEKGIPAEDYWTNHPDETIEGPKSYYFKANPIWINVRRADLQPSDKVHVMLINYTDDCYRCDCFYMTSQKIFEGDMDYIEPGHFSKMSSDPIIIDYWSTDGYGNRTQKALWQEVVVWINGQIYKDLNSGRNLGFNFLDFFKITH